MLVFAPITNPKLGYNPHKDLTNIAYLGGSPAVFIDIYHLPPPLYGTLFGGCAAGSGVGDRQVFPDGETRVVSVLDRIKNPVA